MRVRRSTSSGLNVAGAVAIAEELGTGHTVVTVAVETGLKYLDGDLFDAMPDLSGGHRAMSVGR